MLTPRGKSPLPEKKFSSEEDQTHDAASSSNKLLQPLHISTVSAPDGMVGLNKGPQTEDLSSDLHCAEERHFTCPWKVDNLEK